MEINKSNEWLKMTRELVVRLIEWILNNRFHDSDQDSNLLYADPLNLPMNKEYFGKFGIKKDLENFPYNQKAGELNSLWIVLYLKSMKPFSNTQRSKTLNLKRNSSNQLRVIERWHISLELSSSYDLKALGSCYQKVIKAVASKSVELPAYSYIKAMEKNFIKYDHFLEYELQSKDKLSSKLGEFWTPINHSSTDNSTNWSEFKFDIGWGKLNFKVEYVPKIGLAKINEDLTSDYSSAQIEDEYDSMYKAQIMTEYFGGSTKKSKIEDENEDSSDFELIMTSEVSQIPPANKNIHYKDIRYQTEPQKNAKVNQKFKLPLKLDGLKDLENFDDFELDPDELFRTNGQINHNNLHPDWELDHLRNRWNSDNTACTKVKNILNERKNSGTLVSPFKQFQKQNFEFKNTISPRIMEHYVIDEWYFGEDDVNLSNHDRESNDYSKNKLDKYATIDQVNLNTSISQLRDDSYFSPSFLETKEFKESLNKMKTNSRARLNPFNSSFKQRKFTLSFDGGINHGNEDYEHLMKSYSNVQDAVDKVKMENLNIEEKEGDNFIISIEDDHFSTKNHIDSKEAKDATLSKNKNNPEDPMKMVDKKTRYSTISSQSKVEKSTNKDYDIGFINNDYELEFFKHDKYDSWNASFNSSSDFSSFLNYVEGIKKRLGRKSSKHVCIEENICCAHILSKNQLKIEKNCHLKETLLTNYNEIMKLREKITKHIL